MNEIVKMEAVKRLEEAVIKATEAAATLLRCAESISNPTYIVTMDGRDLEILAVRHFSGVISITVKSPFSDTAYEANRKAIEQQALLNQQGVIDVY